MDVLSVRNVYSDAEKAINKKAAIGADITIENFTDEDVNALDLLDDLDDVDKKTKNTLLKVGVDTEENNRSGSFLQMDQTNVFTNNSMSNSVEVMNMAVALDNFRAIQHPGKMVVLGEMREMGAESVSEHQKVADRLAQMDLTETWLVGNEFGKCDTSAIRNVTLFANVDEVKKRLAESGVAGRLILIKGSNGTRLYQLPELL